MRGTSPPVVLAILQTALLILGVGSLLFALISLADGVAFLRRTRGALRSRGTWQPPAAVIVPVRGADPGLEETIRALEDQAYAHHRVILVTDPDDVAEGLLREGPRRTSTTFVRSLPLRACSGKIAALLAGLEILRPTEELVAFADSDVEPGPDWLAHLVAPLEAASVAAATGYRWYVPARGGLGPALQSAWNSAAANVLFHPRWTYLWGGSCVVRREVLEALGIEARWRRSLSDDMVLTQALKGEGHRIAFAPQATVATRADGTFEEVLQWTDRQACMALLYAPAMARLTLPYALYTGAVVLGAVAAALVPLTLGFLLPALLLLSPVYLGWAKHALRRTAFRHAIPPSQAWRRHRAWFYLAATLLPFVMLRNVRRARRMREVTWRGKRYRLEGPEDVELVSVEPTPPPPPPGRDRTRRGGSAP